MMHRFLLAGQIFVTLAIVAILLVAFDWHAIVRQLASADPSLVAAAATCQILVLLVGAYDIWILLRAVRRIPFFTTLRFYLIGWSTLLLLPGSVGDAAQVVLFREAGVRYRDGAVVYLSDKLISLLGMLIVALSGGFLFFPNTQQLHVLAGIVSITGTLGLLAYTLARRSAHLFVAKLLSPVDLVAAFALAHAPQMALNAAGTACKLLLTGLTHWLAFHAVGVEPSFGVVFTVALLAGLIAYLPVAYNGIGTVELAAVALYGLQNVAQPQVIATYVILRAMMFAIAFVGLFASQLLPPFPAAGTPR